MFVSTKRSRLLTMFPVPAFLAMRGVGCDISDHAIRIVEAVPTATGFSLGRYGAYPLPQGTIVAGAIQDAETLTHVLETIKKEQRLHFVHASLPAEPAYLFTVPVEGAVEELRTTVEFKLEENIPIAPHEAMFDYTLLTREASEQPLEVSVVTLPRTVVEAYVHIFKTAGLVPLSFEIETEALARAIVPLAASGSTMVVDFGAFKTGISVVSRGAAQFTTTIDIGSANLTAVLEKALHVSSEEAERIKRTQGFRRSAANAAVVDALMNPLSALKDEIGRHREYWDTYGEKRARRLPVERVILAGGGANLAGLPEYLKVGLGVSVSRANVWNGWFSFDAMIPDISFEESLSYATAIGLAMREQ